VDNPNALSCHRSTLYATLCTKDLLRACSSNEMHNHKLCLWKLWGTIEPGVICEHRITYERKGISAFGKYPSLFLGVPDAEVNEE
jgi:hypothetical protein